MAAKNSPHKPWGKARQKIEQDAMAEEDEHYISKSQAKRDVEALQKLGVQLLKLSKSTLEKFSLDEKLLDAILLAQTIRSHSGHRRQLQLIGKLMRHVDADAIRLQLERYQHPIEVANSHFHQLEQWRDRLLAEGEPAIEALLTEHSNFERKRLRQLLRNAKKEHTQDKPAKSARQLFKYLKELISP